MTGIDLTPATTAARDAIWRHATRDVTGSIDRATADRLAARAVRAATPLIAAAVREQVSLRALTVLREHTIECTGLGEVTCRACRDRSWMSWGAYHEHLAALIAGGDA